MSDQRPPRLRRRALLTSGAAAAGALLAGPALAGCASARAVANLVVFARPVPLTVMVLGGGADSGTVPGVLQDLVKPVQQALSDARKMVSGLGELTFQTGNDTASWFPLPSTLFNAGQQAQNRTDDPSLPMPDIVITMHSEMPAYLASRALDLEPHLKVHSSLLQGVPASVIRQGRAFGYGQGTVQASLPLLRIPVVCAVRPGVQAVTGGRPWTAEQFQQQLAAMAKDFPPPGGAPIPFVPFGLGIAEMAAVGSGGQIAVSTPTGCQATFADGAAASGILQTLNWASYGARSQPFNQPSFNYGALIADGAWVLSGGLPRFARNGGNNSQVPDPTGWSLAPLPVFPARPAVPVRTIDVMVFRHTKAPDTAAALACALASAEVQAGLMSYRNALVLRPEQAQRQLQVRQNVQGADLIANPDSDITDDDAYGQMAEGNVAARALVRSDLLAALSALTGPAGYFGGFTSNGPQPGGGFRFGSPRTQEPAASVLRAAEAAANSGLAYNA